MAFTDKFRSDFMKFFLELKDRIEREHDAAYPLLKGGCTMDAEFGRRYVRLVRVSGGQRSAYGFVDGNGDIYKAASWKSPAKHVRGSLYDASGGQDACGHYGVVYLN